jgi:predicted metal-dependent peptidase
MSTETALAEQRQHILDMQQERRVEKLIDKVSFAEPVLGVILHSAEHCYTREAKCKTAAIGIVPGGLRVTFNLDFMFQPGWNDTKRMSIIKHEALHVLFGHLFEGKVWSLLQNICDDAVINQFISGLPEGAILPENLPAIALGVDPWSIKPVKRKIGTRVEECPPSSFRERIYKLRGLNLSMATMNWPECLYPRHGLTADQYLQYMNILMQNPNRDLPKDFLEESLKQAGVGVLDPGTHEETQDDIWKDLVRERVKEDVEKRLEQIEAEAREAGSHVETDLIKVLRKIFPKKKLDWREHLASLLHRASEAFAFEATWKRVNRRFGVMAAGEGRTPNLRAAAIVDTSGSVNEKLLGGCESVLRDLTEVENIIHPEFPVVFGDTKVRGEHLFNGKFETQKVRGGGGTDMQPLIKYVRETYNPDIIVICTDGYVPGYDLEGGTDDLVWVFPDKLPIKYLKNMPGKQVPADLDVK